MNAPLGSVSGAALVAVALVVGVHLLLRRATTRGGIGVLGLADRITLVRAWLTAAVAGLAVLSAGGWSVTTPLGVVATVALVLDAVDGRVARRTGTVSRFGARFDMEVDALLVLVLSLHVAATVGGWVVALGLARYAVLLAGVVAPWLRGQVAPRYWRKVVAAVQGVVLVAAAGELLPSAWTIVLLVGAAGLLALSFGTEVRELWLVRKGGRDQLEVPSVRSVVAGAGAVALVWLAVAGPDRLADLSPWLGLTLPLDAVLLLAVVAWLGERSRGLTTVAGFVFGVVLLLRLLDLGFDLSLARPFHPVTEWSYLGPAVHLLADSAGGVVATLSVAGAAVLVAGVLAALPWAVGRLTRPARRHRSRALRVSGVLLLAWVVLALAGVRTGGGEPVAGTGAVGFAVRQAAQARTDLGDQAAFGHGLGADRLREMRSDQLLRGLQGKDVLIVFVESYGRVALDGGPEVAGPVDAALGDAGRRLGGGGWSSRSAWLTSPTFGGTSWLAHSTLQSGLWVDGQGRYDRLLASSRMTLSGAFREAGWRTVADIPSNGSDWPEGAYFYGFEEVHDVRDVGYAGPRLGYARVPDEFTLRAFAERELRPGHAPVMAEIDLDSSHVPWSPLPRLLGWDAMGDGSVYATAAGREASGDEAPGSGGVAAAYGRSIAYAWSSLVTFLEASGDDDLVVLVLGDHQPSRVVSGLDAGHDVPVTLLSRDAPVVARAESWGWQPGLRPSDAAPVWRMDVFRDRFLAAYAAP